jgi:hypothetical protein
VVSSTPRSLYPQGKAPGTLWIGGWVVSGVGLDLVEREKSLPTAGNRTLAVYPIGRRYTDYVWVLLEITEEVRII